MTTITTLALFTLVVGLVGIVAALFVFTTRRHHRYQELRTRYAQEQRRLAHLALRSKGIPKSTAARTVRDFLYVDGERLYSLYSQIFEGVADEIVQSYVGASASQERQRSEPLSGGAIEAQVAKISTQTESRVLYDHMYNQLEAALSSALMIGADITEENYLRKLSTRMMVKATGDAEVEDFERVGMFVDQFNRIGEAIAYSSLISSGIADAVEGLEKGGGSKDRNERARARYRAKQLDAKKIAEQMGLQQDETALQNIKMMTELFNKGSYEIVLDPGGGVTFRGVLDRQWLRMSEGLLRALYGVSPATQWTMVGQVTHVPGLREAPGIGEEQNGPVNKDIDDAHGSPSMRDPLRKLFRACGAFERMFLESKEGTEIVVAPLAIYREFTVQEGREKE